MTDIEDIAARLGFDLDAAAIEECAAAADDLAAAAATVETDSGDSGTAFEQCRLDSDYGALLWGYDQPRRADTDGSLEDVTVAVKDNVAARGIPLTCGSESFSHVPSFDATVVENLLAAGATVAGKANMDAFAFGPSGEFSGIETVVNPHDPDRVPGGSSSGSGAAVAAGEVDVTLGTDTGGSVRIPAACCGVVGHKPSFGRVSRNGVVPFAPSLDTVGPLAPAVETAREVFRAIAGHDPADATTVPALPDVDGTVESIGIPEAFLAECSDPIRTAIEALRRALAADGLDVVDVPVTDLPIGAVEEAYLLIGATEFSWYIRQHGTVRGTGATYERDWSRALASFFDSDGVSDHVAKRVLPSASLDADRNGAPYVAARREANQFASRVDGVLGDVDALLVPTIRTLPPTLGEVEATERLFDLLGNTAPFNLSGHPATSVPIDAADGLPISVQVVTSRFADERALAGAERIERVVADDDALSPPTVPV